MAGETSAWGSPVYTNSSTEQRHPSWHPEVTTPDGGWIPGYAGRRPEELADWYVIPSATSVWGLSWTEKAVAWNGIMARARAQHRNRIVIGIFI
ncbi:hypothetical protein [Methanolinea mesophila]|uniref:hypothetical protein n=1 Tax=Methanolinea mesophila TaxID=547055 RepID=UPI001AE742A1|nr:hypothetical protein [Methanolinea mesophila]